MQRQHRQQKFQGLHTFCLGTVKSSSACKGYRKMYFAMPELTQWGRGLSEVRKHSTSQVCNCNSMAVLWRL